MNSLEFIEKEIKKLKDFLELEDVLCLQPEKNYKYSHEKLKIFQQIKAELEAWYVAKERVEIIEAVTTFASSTYAKETTPIIGNIEPVEIRISIVGQDKIKTFLKALEVKDDK